LPKKRSDKESFGMVESATGYINKGPAITENGLFNTGWPNFPLSSMAAHYSMAKFFGYVFQATYHDATQWIDKSVLKNPQILSADGKAIVSQQAKQYFNVFEAVVFAFVSSISFFMEKSQLKKTVYDAIAAERGIKPESVTIFSMYKSDNPFIRSLRDRFTIQNATRIPAALLFAKNLTVGILALVTSFTLERSIFVENNSYDVLRSMIREVQTLKISGNQEKERVHIGLQRAIQRTLTENHRMVLSPQQLDANKDIFDRLTKNILDGVFSTNEAIYILGEMANRPDSTAKLLTDIEKIEQQGIRGFARHKSLLIKEKSDFKQQVLAQKHSNELFPGVTGRG